MSRNRVLEFVETYGFSSVIDFVRSREAVPLTQLASIQQAVSAVDLEKALHEEALTLGRGDAEYILKTLLIRRLVLLVPDGIRMHGEEALIHALVAWIAGLPEEHRSMARRIARSFQHSRELPDSWLPTDVDDPLFTKLFQDGMG